MATRLRPVSPAAGPSSRVPPHNLEAEESVIGACLLSREAIANVLEVVTAQDFYKPAHGEIFTTILELYGRGDPVDAVTLAEELRRKDLLEPIGGMPYLHTIVSSVPTAGSAAHYARIVEENALLRRLIEASQTISEIAFGVPEDVEDAVDQAENLVYQVSQRRLSQDFRQLSELLKENMEHIEKLYERGASITGLPSGFTELDNLTAGFQPSNLIIVAARPSQGKSSFAISVAQHLAVTGQIPVVVFSLEMSKMELVQRLICAEARVDSNRLRRGALSDSDWPKLSHALGRLAEAPIFIDDTPNVTIMEMRAKCRRLKSKHGLGLIIVDYLQLMQPIRRTENRVQEVTEISRSIKILARELEVPVLAVSQLSRNVEYRADKRPVLADLRESGCLAGETLIPLADTGERVPIRKLAGKSGFSVWALNQETLHLESARVSRAFSTGVKPVFRLSTALGRTVRATSNHPFLTPSGWKRLDQLAVGKTLATPSRVSTGHAGGSVLSAENHHIRRSRHKETAGSSTYGDVYWDQIAALEPDGVEAVFDLTVPGPHNFVADDIVVHNSLEQDSDLVLFIYRDEVYHPDSAQKGIAEIHLAKHRNGPIGKVELAFMEHYTKFANLARGV